MYIYIYKWKCFIFCLVFILYLLCICYRWWMSKDIFDRFVFSWKYMTVSFLQDKCRSYISSLTNGRVRYFTTLSPSCWCQFKFFFILQTDAQRYCLLCSVIISIFRIMSLCISETSIKIFDLSLITWTLLRYLIETWKSFL